MNIEWDIEERSSDGTFIFRVKQDKPFDIYKLKKDEYTNPYFEHAYSDGSMVTVERGRLIGGKFNLNLLSVLLRYDYTDLHNTNADVKKLSGDDVPRRILVRENYEWDGSLRNCSVNDAYIASSRFKESESTQNLMQPENPQEYLKYAHKAFEMRCATPIEILLDQLKRLNEKEGHNKSYTFISQ